jgi:cellulose synthase (UDP-forming)
MASVEAGGAASVQEIAPSGSIATAARLFGDEYPPVTGQGAVRLAGVMLLVATALYVPWMLSSLNDAVPWLAWPFAITNLFTLATGVLAVFNAWWRTAPTPSPLATGAEPSVAVIVTACAEPVPMILRTISSVLDQDWPRDRLVLIVSDDGHDPALETALERFPVLYHSPQPRDSPGRDGAAKAGNLNSALSMIDDRFPEARYIETRDADDELGSNGFLRQVIGQLEANHQLAFVQTIKEAQVSAGDPFNNREGIFYRGQMLARNAANAVFPCGSGVVWRREALRDIGNFPTWNLVEDIQSGVEALCRGWQSMYLPVVGAVGQHSPEDIPNVYKQRGTWAIDTVRLIIWRGLKGMSLRQKAQFLELLVFYLSSFTVLVYIPALCLALLGWAPLDSNALGFLTRMLPMVVATEIWLLALNMPYNDRRKRQRQRYRALWRVRTMWVGLAPVFMKASFQAVINGPNKKPVYRVTRKTHAHAWHWRQTLPQTTIVLTVVAVAIYAARFQTLPSLILLTGTVYWGGLNVVLLSSFVTRSWHGLARATDRITSEPQARAAGSA